MKLKVILFSMITYSAEVKIPERKECEKLNGILTMNIIPLPA
jgi:hypothetical protein